MVPQQYGWEVTDSRHHHPAQSGNCNDIFMVASTAFFTCVVRQLWQYSSYNGLTQPASTSIIRDCVASAGLPSTLAMKIDVGWGRKYIIFARPRLSPQIIESMMDSPSSAVMDRDGLHNRWSRRQSQPETGISVYQWSQINTEWPTSSNEFIQASVTFTTHLTKTVTFFQLWLTIKGFYVLKPPS